ncbi:MAG TPA: serine hydrolase domain-containing protein [Acetobacteraceae bacterium]|jgi:CubicO group peptidase (beta-lactamase class C family)
MKTLDTLLVCRRVERLLAPWRRTDGPGVTLGVVLGRELAAHDSAGMASLEHGVPIGPQTTFRIASVSKQFTCAAVLLLAAEGRLAIEDDVRRYIPALPDLGHRITLAHLMHNTSGIRDMLEIMRLGGADLGQPCQPEDLLDGVCRQRGLNFVPGSRYLYSNSNFMLLGRIVELVSGRSLRDFLDQRIFAPLGMNATRHVERTTEVVPDLATGYFPAPGGGWMRAQHNFPLHGEGGLVSCVADLALWHAHFAAPRIGGTALADALATMTPFNNGLPNTYARGLRIKTHRGVTTIGHDGLWPGYRASFVRIPDHDAAVICISNDATADPHDLAFQVVDTLVEGKPGVPAVPPMPPTDRLAGRYLNRESGATVDVAIDDSGCVTASTHGAAFTTIPTSDGGLATSRGSADFTMRPTADGRLAVERDAGVCETLDRAAPGAHLPADLAGRFYNPDIAATWTIAATGTGMTMRVTGPLRSAGPWEIEPIEGDFIRIISPMTLFRAWLDVRVLRDAAGRITGLHADGGRVKDLVFEREAG